jgi:hypothetical protein
MIATVLLRSLDENHPPLLWALQGFLGGQAKSPEPVAGHHATLLDEVVVGHQQYQQAINDQLHFRRAFAEVFRRRSLLFMGSGLQEDYLVNLFSEIVHHHGLGALPHFALVSSEDKKGIDTWFLEVRLGIVPVDYGSHDDLPGHLKNLAAAVTEAPWGRRAALDGSSATRCQLHELSYRLIPSGVPGEELEVRVVNSPLPLPDKDRKEASLVSVGRWENEPMVGNLASSHLKSARQHGKLTASDKHWVPLGESPSYVFRWGSSSIFAVAARRRDSHGRQYDVRDLTIIPEAVDAALYAIEMADFSTALVGAVASGPGSDLHPLHTFAQTLRGLRLFAGRGGERRLRRISLFIVDPRVWSPVVAGKVAMQEMLGSDLVTYHVDLQDAEGRVEHIRATLPVLPTAEVLMQHFHFDPNRWRFTLVPRPTDEEDNADLPLDITVLPTMTMILTPRSAANPNQHRM